MPGTALSFSGVGTPARMLARTEVDFWRSAGKGPRVVFGRGCELPCLVRNIVFHGLASPFVSLSVAVAVSVSVFRLPSSLSVSVWSREVF
eukprot:879932-Rhodomonas_salina.3